MKALIFISLIMCFSHLQAINLQDLLKQAQISVEVKGKGGHTGECIQLVVKNISNKPLQCEIKSGLFLLPEDSSVQRMMITQDLPFALAVNQTKTIGINAFCTQAHNSSPNETTLFKVGKFAEGKLLELAQIISKNKFYTSAAQSAIWCLTDKSDLYTITSDNPVESKILREFISKATGQPLEMNLSKSNNSSTPTVNRPYVEHIVKDTIRFVNREEGSTSLVLFDSEGKELLMFFKDRPLRKGSNVRYSYSLTYANIDKGNYFIRLTRNTGELIYEKKIVISE